jgi:ornithine carbamoyltransferase
MAVMTMTTGIKKPEALTVRNLLADPDLTYDDLRLLFDLSERVKTSPGKYAHVLRGKQLAMIFEKPSLRTRTTFEVGITSLGGFAVYLEHTKPRLGEREAIKDIARNLERWVHGVAARTFAHESVLELAANAAIPVINALTDLYHPCQALADYFTLHEKFGDLKGLKLTFVGDGNNVCHSLMVLGAKLGVSVRVATPPGYEPKSEVLEIARAFADATGSTVDTFHDPVQAVAGAHAVYTDVWTSMGQEFAAHLRNQVFAPYRVTKDLMAVADPGALFMHCLPAHRSQEVTDEVIDSPQSIVYDQAENRLHAQKALMILLMQDGVRTE